MHRSLRIILLMVLCFQPFFSAPVAAHSASAAPFSTDPSFNRPADTWSAPRCAALDRPPDPDAPAAPSAPYSTYLPLTNSRMTPAAVTDPKLTNDLGQTTFTLGSNNVVVTTTDDYGQPVKGMKVVVLSTPTKLLAVTEDPQGRYLPSFKEITINNPAADFEKESLNYSTSILLLLDIAATGKGIYDVGTDFPTILEVNWYYSDVCWTVTQIANANALVGGIIGSLLGGHVLGIAIGLSGPILKDLFTQVFCAFHWDHPVVIRQYYIPGLTMMWSKIMGPCPDRPQENICIAAPITSQLTGLVTNARTGSGLFGAYVSDPISGRTQMTDPDGFYTLIGLPVGYHQIRVTKTGFVGKEEIVYIGTVGSWANFSLSPEGTSTSEFRFILNWGSEPRDLDSHLWLPTTNPAHISYYSRGTLDAFPYAMLDLDDTNGYGPETLTMYRNYSGSYLYAVHRYAGTGTLAGSGATVDIFRGSDLFQRVTAPSTGTGDWWVVATVDGTTGFITVLNYITANSPRSDPASAPEILAPKATLP